jgi:hypothetical protein
MRPMDTPLQWGAATVTWAPDGYALRVPMHLDERATDVLEQN